MKMRSKILFLVSAGAAVNVILASTPDPMYEKPNISESAEFSVTAVPIADEAKHARIISGEGWPNTLKDQQSVLVKRDTTSQLVLTDKTLQDHLVQQEKLNAKQGAMQAQKRLQHEQDSRVQGNQGQNEALTSAMLSAKAGAFDQSVQLASVDTGTQTDVPTEQPGAVRLAGANDSFMQVTVDKVKSPVAPASLVSDVARHIVVTPGVSYYRLQLPDFMAPISIGAGSAPGPYPSKDSTQYNLNEYGVMPTLNFDYSFQNTHILTGLLGDRLHTVLDLQYMHGNRQTSKDVGGDTGFVWYLTGGAAPINYEDEANFNTQKTDLTYDMIDVTFALAGDNQLSSYMIFKPRMGVVFTYLKQQYNYNVYGMQPGGAESFNVSGYNKLKTTYFGPMIGGQLVATVGKHVGTFLDMEFQALHANTSLNADQVVESVLKDTSNVQNTDSLFTYRAKLGLGLDYYWQGVHAPSSVKLGLKAGVDFLGYIPEVVNPHESGDKEAHTESATALNNYINLNIAIPLM